jgi:two-component system OmpR family response regulator
VRWRAERAADRDGPRVIQEAKLELVHGKVLVVGCPTRVNAECGALLGSAGLSVVTQGFRGLDTTMAVLEPDLAIAELQNGDPATTIGLLRSHSDVPVLLLVPKQTPSAVTIAAFHAGADDVMEHPINCQELLDRVRAILDRRDVDGQMRVRDLVIDEADSVAWRGDQQLALTPTEFQILSVLARNADVVMSKRRLLSEVWGFDEFDVNLVEVHVSALRRKLEEFGPRLVETVRSRGYVIRAGRKSDRTAQPTAHQPAPHLHLVPPRSKTE